MRSTAASRPAPPPDSPTPSGYASGGLLAEGGGFTSGRQPPQGAEAGRELRGADRGSEPRAPGPQPVLRPAQGVATVWCQCPMLPAAVAGVALGGQPAAAAEQVRKLRDLGVRAAEPVGQFALALLPPLGNVPQQEKLGPLQ